MGDDAAGDGVDRGGRPDHDAERHRRRPVPDPAQHAAQDEAADQGADAERDRAFRRERPDRADRQQGVEHQRPQHGRRDQRGHLVEGAVADPPVVVVVEAVELDHDDPAGAEEDRPEEVGDVGRGGRRGDRDEGDDQRRPVAQRQQAAQQRAAPARAFRPAQPEPVGRLSRDRGALLGRGGGRALLGGDLLGVWRLGHPQPSNPSERQVSSGLRRFASARSAWAASFSPRLVRAPWPAGSRASSCGSRGRSPARSGGSPPRYSPFSLGEEAELQVGSGRPGLDRTRRLRRG